ncbi:MAG TPA: lysophospholipid acyltransferase family protein [Rhizobiaceae bacterium]|nr:lysophospholipid acyltransferase family protein [Rhizobiaceae bacterium]
MIGTIRTILGLLGIVAITVWVIVAQTFAMKTGLIDEHRWPRWWHTNMLRMLGIRVHAHGEMARERPLLIAANHISWTDIMALGSLGNVTFIAKSDMARWPLIGFLCGLQRTIFVERERRRKSGDQASEVGQRLAGNAAVVLFAEGTTSDGNFLSPFKSTLFAAADIALAQGKVERMHIQPVAIAYTRLHGLPMGRRHRMIASWIGDADLVPHIFRLLREGAIDVHVSFGAPVEYTPESNRKIAARQAQEEVRAMMIERLRLS